MARGAPRSPSYVRSISSGRHWVRTWMVTSSGIRSSSIRWRRKSKSGRLALGKPTSISLKPMATTASNRRSLRAGSIGSMRAWLPSRRSTEHHRGALVIWRFGHSRSGRCRGSGKNGLYFSNGIFFGMGDPFRADKKPPGPEAQEVKASVGERSRLRKEEGGRQVAARGQGLHEAIHTRPAMLLVRCLVNKRTKVVVISGYLDWFPLD